MQSGSTGPVRPVLEEEPPHRPRWQAVAAVAIGLVVLTLILLALGRDRAEEETTVPTTPAPSSTAAVATTSGAMPTTTTPAARGLDALAAFQAETMPPKATCPPGSTPDTLGDPSAPRPALDSLDPFGSLSAAFDRESGLLVFVVEDPLVYPEHRLTTWTFDPCRNRWQQVASDGLAPAFSRLHITYDADSDRMVGIDGSGVVWAYDANTDTWTSRPWTAERPALPVGWSTLFHDRSGLLLLHGGLEEAIWAYDADTDDRYQLGPWYTAPEVPPNPSVVFYDPTGDRFYFFRFLSGPASTTWRYEPGWGWEQLDISTPSCPCVEFGDFFTGAVAFDEATGRAAVFCGTTLFATFDPAGWEWLVAQGSGEVPGRRGNPVYDSANDGFIFVGPSVWAFDDRTGEWIELLPAE